MDDQAGILDAATGREIVSTGAKTNIIPNPFAKATKLVRTPPSKRKDVPISNIASDAKKINQSQENNDKPTHRITEERCKLKTF